MNLDFAFVWETIADIVPETQAANIGISDGQHKISIGDTLVTIGEKDVRQMSVKSILKILKKS